jgi:hypothetical protein
MKPKTERQWEAITRRAFNATHRDCEWHYLPAPAQACRIRFTKLIAAEILKGPKK